MNTNAENVIAILLSMKILSAIWNKFITIIDLFATFAPKFSNWGEVSWFILEWYIILLVSYVFEHQIYMIWKYVDSVVRWFFSKPHKFAKMADLDLIIGRLNTIWFRELRIIRICTLTFLSNKFYTMTHEKCFRFTSPKGSSVRTLISLVLFTGWTKSTLPPQYIIKTRTFWKTLLWIQTLTYLSSNLTY